MSVAERISLLCASLLLVACLNVWALGMQEIVDSRALPVRGAVVISTGSSDVTVRADDVDEIIVGVVHTYPAGSYRPLHLVQMGTITLKEEFLRQNLTGRSTWSITVPRNTSINCDTGSGGVLVEGIGGKISIDTGSGRVEVRDCRSRIVVNTGSGRVYLEDCQGDLDVDTGSGRIKIRGVQGTIRANTGSGGADIGDGRGSFDIDSGSGDIVVSGAVIEGESVFDAGSGDVEVTLAESPANNVSVGAGSGDAVLNYGGHSIAGQFELTARKDRGRIVCPFPFDEESTFTQSGSTYMRKSFARGSDGPKVAISTGSGTAELRQR